MRKKGQLIYRKEIKSGILLLYVIGFGVTFSLFVTPWLGAFSFWWGLGLSLLGLAGLSMQHYICSLFPRFYTRGIELRSGKRRFISYENIHTCVCAHRLPGLSSPQRRKNAPQTYYEIRFNQNEVTLAVLTFTYWHEIQRLWEKIVRAHPELREKLMPYDEGRSHLAFQRQLTALGIPRRPYRPEGD